MKKLILSLVAGVAMIAGTSFQTNACSGTFYICSSQLSTLIQQFEQNCAVHDAIEIIVIECNGNETLPTPVLVSKSDTSE